MFNDKHTNELETALATAERERDTALAENAALKQKCEWFRAAHMLLAQDEVFVRAPTEPGFINMASATVVDGEPAIYVLCSDTFAYACADAEEATYADATELLRIGVSEGWPGLVRWVQARRHEKGDPCEPIVRVRDRMATIDSMRERAEKAERERDALRYGSAEQPTASEVTQHEVEEGISEWLHVCRSHCGIFHIEVSRGAVIDNATNAAPCDRGHWWALGNLHPGPRLRPVAPEEP